VKSIASNWPGRFYQNWIALPPQRHEFVRGQQQHLPTWPGFFRTLLTVTRPDLPRPFCSPNASVHPGTISANWCLRRSFETGLGRPGLRRGPDQRRFPKLYADQILPRLELNPAPASGIRTDRGPSRPSV